MSSTEDFFTSFSFEKEIERAEWFKNDLDQGGWKEIHNSPGRVYWRKTFPENEVPLKILFKIDLPLSAESYLEMVHPRNLNIRQKWDRVFVGQEMVKTYPDDQGYILYCPLPTSWPLKDRSFMLFVPPTKEIDWFGKRCFLLIQKNAWHSSKPPGEDGRVRATNGGNFFVISPDENNPNTACTIFSLSNNNYNGWLPNKHIEFLLSRAVVSSFNRFLNCMIEGYEKYYKQKWFIRCNDEELNFWVDLFRPFYRYGGHSVRFKEYYRMSRGHEHVSFVFSSAFREIFS